MRLKTVQTISDSENSDIENGEKVIMCSLKKLYEVGMNRRKGPLLQEM